MEVYVRDEELESKNRSYKFVGNDKIKFSTNNMGIIQIEEYFAQIKSLTQHDAEIRKPLEDEIESLKNKLADLTEEYKLTVEAFDREYAKQNVQLRKAFNERNSEILKVITELEEWVDKQPKATYWLNDNESEEHLAIKNINQKLNEMKGEMKGEK